MSSEEDSSGSEGSECEFVDREVEEGANMAVDESQENDSFTEPYSGEPLAGPEWISNYQRIREDEAAFLQEYKLRLNGEKPVSEWCRCGQCSTQLLKNPFECQCCEEMENCTEALLDPRVLVEVENVPSCITNHPGFRPICLEPWSLRLIADKFRRKDKSKYTQQGAEEIFLRSVSYRQFTRFVHGNLGKIRKPLPSCVYNIIRKTFGVEGEDNFRGFEDEDSD